MNYKKHYDLLMKKALIKKPKVGYFERHRIVPGCMGGEYVYGNIAWLTPEQHYVAHQLLIKIYPENKKLIHAAIMMGGTRSNNRLYGWLRKAYSEYRSESMKGEKNHRFGKPGYFLGKNMQGFKGKSHTKSHLKYMSNIIKEHYKNNGHHLKGKIRVTNGIEEKLIKPENLVQGWRRGRKPRD